MLQISCVLWPQIKWLRRIAVGLHTLYPSSNCSCSFAGPQDSSSLLVAMTGYHLHTSGNTLTLCIAMSSVYTISKLIIIFYRLLVITTFLGLAYLCTLLVDCNIPARPASRGRRHAQSSNVSEDGQASTQMFHQHQSHHCSLIIVRNRIYKHLQDVRMWETVTK
jgi:hypothetical protein